MRFLIAVLLMALVSTSCAVSQRKDFSVENKEKINRITMNMSKKDLLILMGTSTYRPNLGDPVPNPYRTEALRTRKGAYEVLFYFTEPVKANMPITDAELTPVVLRNEKVIGWGWAAYQEVREE